MGEKRFRKIFEMNKDLLMHVFGLDGAGTMLRYLIDNRGRFLKSSSCCGLVLVSNQTQIVKYKFQHDLEMLAKHCDQLQITHRISLTNYLYNTNLAVIFTETIEDLNLMVLTHRLKDPIIVDFAKLVKEIQW